MVALTVMAVWVNNTIVDMNSLSIRLLLHSQSKNAAETGVELGLFHLSRWQNSEIPLDKYCDSIELTPSFHEIGLAHCSVNVWCESKPALKLEGYALCGKQALMAESHISAIINPQFFQVNPLNDSVFNPEPLSVVAKSRIDHGLVQYWITR